MYNVSYIVPNTIQEHAVHRLPNEDMVIHTSESSSVPEMASN